MINDNIFNLICTGMSTFASLCTFMIAHKLNKKQYNKNIVDEYKLHMIKVKAFIVSNKSWFNKFKSVASLYMVRQDNNIPELEEFLNNLTIILNEGIILTFGNQKLLNRKLEDICVACNALVKNLCEYYNQGMIPINSGFYNHEIPSENESKELYRKAVIRYSDEILKTHSIIGEYHMILNKLYLEI